MKVGDFAIIGGLAAIKQFVRIGAHAIIGGMAGVESDVIPYGMVIGERGWLNGLNMVGMKRRGFSKEAIQKIQDAYMNIFFDSELPLSQRISSVKEKYQMDDDLKALMEFFDLPFNSLCQPRAG